MDKKLLVAKNQFVTNSNSNNDDNNNRHKNDIRC